MGTLRKIALKLSQKCPGSIKGEVQGGGKCKYGNASRSVLTRRINALVVPIAKAPAASAGRK